MSIALLATDLATRLRREGLPSAMRVVLHTNRSTLVTRTARGTLRVHAGFAAAPDEVLAAIVRWARPRGRREERLEAQRLLTRFPVQEHSPTAAPRRAGRTGPDPVDLPMIQQMGALHRKLNEQHFAGALGSVTLRLSGRMRRRLGEFRPAIAGAPPEIAVSRRHLGRDGWVGVEQTLLHEMVHQWQSETGRPLDHGREFRRKCAGLGIEGRAVTRRDLPRSDYLPAAAPSSLSPD